MSLIRPDAAKELSRWSEPLAAVALFALGLWWGLTAFGVLQWLGWIFVLVGGALGFLGVRRARFWRGADGAGHVQVAERAITYFGPQGGGTIDVDDLTHLSLVRHGSFQFWRLTGPTHAPLLVPVDASGADALYDVFANLPGIQMETLLRALDRPDGNEVVIWARNLNRLH